MSSLPRRAVALAVAAAVASPAALPAQEATAPGAGLAGSWSGWAKLVNDWPGLTCRYEGGADAKSVRLELAAEGGILRGSVAIDLEAEPGSGCPPLRKRYDVSEAAAGPDALSFTDSGGNEWTLARRRNGTVLQGLLAWRQGGAEQPLAEGFVGPAGRRVEARLNGEVRLRRPDDADPAGAAGTATDGATTAPGVSAGAAATPSSGGGSHLRNLGLVLGANVVGLGLLYGVNKVGKGSTSGVLTCSPRVCIVGPTINDPCFCEGNVISGAPCGTTSGGAPIGAPCDGKDVPCQAALSCNSGVCQDRDGRCPF